MQSLPHVRTNVCMQNESIKVWREFKTHLQYRKLCVRCKPTRACMQVHVWGDTSYYGDVHMTRDEKYPIFHHLIETACIWEATEFSI